MIRDWLDIDGRRRWTGALSRWGTGLSRGDVEAPSEEPPKRESSPPPPRAVVGFVSDRQIGEGVVTPDGTAVRSVSPHALGALALRGELPRGLVLDLRGPAATRHALARQLADVPRAGRVWVALVDEAEGAADAARIDVGAILRCEDESAMAEAAVVCHALAERAAPKYSSLEQTYRQLFAMYARLSTRSSDVSARQAMIVHDLRSPLGVMRGALGELLDNAPPGSDDHALLAMVERASQQLTDLVDRLEQLYGSAPQPMHRERIDVAALARGVAGSLRYSPEAKGKQVHVRAPGALHLDTDRQDLVRTLTNLIGNALRHARATVEVEVDGDAEEVRLLVLDDGPGIPPAMLERVFQRFVRNPGAGRMGLGLAIVQQGVERHGGSVAAHNRAEREGPGVPGACFVVRLPHPS
jgi:signal transduction histidine kinase